MRLGPRGAAGGLIAAPLRCVHLEGAVAIVSTACEYHRYHHVLKATWCPRKQHGARGSNIVPPEATWCPRKQHRARGGYGRAGSLARPPPLSATAGSGARWP